MTNNVVSIDGSPGIPNCVGTPQQTVISYLEELMALVRSGQVQAIMGIAEHSDGLVQRYVVGRSEEHLRVVGALEALKKELMG